MRHETVILKYKKKRKFITRSYIINPRVLLYSRTRMVHTLVNFVITQSNKNRNIFDSLIFARTFTTIYNNHGRDECVYTHFGRNDKFSSAKMRPTGHKSTDRQLHIFGRLPRPALPYRRIFPLFFLYSSNEFERTIVGSCRSSNSSSGTSKQQQRDTSTGRPTAATTPVDCSSNAIRTTTNDRFSVAFVNRTIFDLIY